MKSYSRESFLNDTVLNYQVVFQKLCSSGALFNGGDGLAASYMYLWRALCEFVSYKYTDQGYQVCSKNVRHASGVPELFP